MPVLKDCFSSLEVNEIEWLRSNIGILCEHRLRRMDQEEWIKNGGEVLFVSISFQKQNETH